MQLLCDGMVSQAPTKSPVSLLPPYTTAHGARAAYGCPSSRVFFYRTLTRFSCVRAAGASVDDCVVKPSGGEMTFYDLLGIPETGTLPEIKQAYKQLARKFHPDVSPPGRVEEHTRRFIRVHEAYETLSDPMRRAVYDNDLARGILLAFSARKMSQFDEETEGRSEWKNQWQSQLSELKKRSKHRDSRGNSSWGARMRRQNNDP